MLYKLVMVDCIKNSLVVEWSCLHAQCLLTPCIGTGYNVHYKAISFDRSSYSDSKVEEFEFPQTSSSDTISASK